MNNIWILAQAGNSVDSTSIDNTPFDEVENETAEGADGSQKGGENNETPAPNPIMRYAPIIVLFVVMYFLLIKGPKKKKKQHTQMVKSIAKNARIQTIGGIIGTVIEIKENEIIIKIDESNNTKMRISKGAVSIVLSENK